MNISNYLEKEKQIVILKWLSYIDENFSLACDIKEIFSQNLFNNLLKYTENEFLIKFAENN